MNKNVLSILIAAVLLLSLFGQAAFAAETVSPAATQKTETVYVNLENDGSAGMIYVVNAFDTRGKINDYGDYAEIKNLTDTSTIAYANGHIIAQSDGGAFYYQGRLDRGELPWDISLKYYLDGKEISVSELAGESGSFELQIHIAPGDAAFAAFYERYMVQISLSLEKDHFTDIIADGASINVVGRTETISFTHMLGAEKTYFVNAAAHEFTMSGISFHAASIGNINLDFDTEDLSGKIGDEFDGLIDGAGQLRDGANKLRDGSNKFNDSMLTMVAQAGDFAAGVGALHASAGQVDSGAVQFGEGLSALAFASAQISENLSLLNAQAAAIPQPNAQLVAYAQTLAQGDDPNLAALASSYLAQNEIISQFALGLAGINAAYTQFDTSLQSGDTANLTDSYTKLQNGIAALSSAIGQLDIAASNKLAPGISTASSVYANLNKGTAALAEGIAALDKNVAEIPELLKNKISELEDSILPSGEEKVSFVSDKNVVDGVLFVMQTEAIENVPIATEVIAPRKPESFIEKFLNLFGLFNPEQ